MEKGKYGGIVSAMITPCSEPGVPDPDGAYRLAGILAEKGCDGLFVLSSTGELPMLDESHRRELVREVSRGAGGNALVYAGISGCGQVQAVRYAEYAARDGADVVIVMAPFFLALSQEGLYEYVCSIADRSPLPLGIYNHVRMPSHFETSTLKQLSGHPNIVAIKDTDTDMDRSLARVDTLRDCPIAFFQGREPFLRDSFQAGAEGCVTALANIAPEFHRDLFKAVETGDEARGQALQEALNDLGSIFQLPGSKSSFAGFSYALRELARLRGWLDTSAGMVPGFTSDIKHDNSLREIAERSGIL